MNLNDLPDMSEALRQVYEKKKLDPVGKEDGDIDNDGDKDSSDSYLLNRRKTVTKAMGKKTHLCAKMVKKEGKTYETIPEQHTMLEDGTVTHYDITDGETILENVPVEDLEIVIAEAHEHFDNHDKNAEVLGEDIEEGYKEIDREKRVKMYRKAGNAAREGDSETMNKYVSAINKHADNRGIQYPTGKKKKTSVAMKKEETEEVEEGMKAARDNVGADTCWDGYKAKGTKKKNGKEVPNCVKEGFAFSEQDLEELELYGEEIDALTDEELIDFFEDVILEMAEDDEDLLEICEALEDVEVLSERMDPKEVQRRRDQAKDRLATGAAMKKAAAKSDGPSRMDRLKSAAKGAGARVKSAVKSGAKKVAGAAGKVAGEFSAAKDKQKAKAMSRKDDAPKKDAPKKASGVTSPVSDKGRATSTTTTTTTSSSGGGEERGSTRRAVGGALKKVGGAIKRGLKKVVGKTARVVSKGSDKLAKKLGENYDEIAHLYESGLFTIEEIENVIELYKGKHGQSDKEYADSRSSGGKMVSGDSKGSGAEYTHGRRVKAANPGMQPDVGGKTKPKSQGKMDKGTRADLQYRKANMKAGK